MKQSVALITGANTGIGRITALTLAGRGYQLILAYQQCRCGWAQGANEAVLRDGLWRESSWTLSAHPRSLKPATKPLPSRIIHIASRAHWMARTIPWENLRSPTRSLTGISEYAISKLCNILYTKSIAQRLKHTGISCCALHPGKIAVFPRLTV